MRNLGRLGVLVLALACGKKTESTATVADAGGAGGAGGPVTAREVWSATILLPSGSRDLVITFERSGDAWAATMAIPSVTKKIIPLADVQLEPEKIAFTLEKTGAPKETWEHYELIRAKDAGEARGLMNKGLAFKMVRLAEGEAPHTVDPRPQTPKPPFPYQEREVVVDAPDGAKLAGSLTIPQGTGPFPAVLLISGSGQQDRDETIFGHKPNLLIADRLTRDGFVVLRLDNRTTGKTTGAVGTIDDEITDGVASVNFLKTQKEVDAKRIGLIGHSTGGMVAPYVAVQTKSIAFIVSLAGPSLSGAELVPLQVEILSRAAKTPEDEIQRQVEMQRKVSIAAVKSPEAAKAALIEGMTPEVTKALGRAPTPAEMDLAVAGPLKEATKPWLVSFYRLDPRPAWRQLELPVLLVIGDKDTQVPADINMKTLAETIKNPALLTTKKLPGLNHLYQHANTGFLEEYGTIEETFDPAALDLIAGWLSEQAGLTKK